MQMVQQRKNDAVDWMFGFFLIKTLDLKVFKSLFFLIKKELLLNNLQFFQGMIFKINFLLDILKIKVTIILYFLIFLHVFRFFWLWYFYLSFHFDFLILVLLIINFHLLNHILSFLNIHKNTDILFMILIFLLSIVFILSFL